MSAVKLTGNFLATARCLIFADSASGVWSFNQITNTLTINAAGGGTGSANPSATIGLAAVNGSASTWMTSDSAPPLSQAITPTWTGLHTFGDGLTVSAGTTTISGHTLTLTATASVGGTNTGDQVIPAGANPSATIGLAAVDGSASTWMTSDSAPALSQAITPTWTGAHTFTPAGAAVGITINGNATGYALSIVSGGGGSISITGAAGTSGLIDLAGNGNVVGTSSLAVGQSGGGASLILARGSQTLVVENGNGSLTFAAATGSVTFSKSVGVNGNSPPAKVTGWGTPTGQTVVNNFAAGAGTSVLQMSEAIAQIITDLKAFGIYGA